MRILKHVFEKKSLNGDLLYHIFKCIIKTQQSNQPGTG